MSSLVLSLILLSIWRSNGIPVGDIKTTSIEDSSLQQPHASAALTGETPLIASPSADAETSQDDDAVSLDTEAESSSASRRVTPSDRREIKYDELSAKLFLPETILLDIRTRRELQVLGRIPNSQNLPSGELDAALNMTPDEFLDVYGFTKPQREDQLIVSCQSGGRVARSVPVFERNGYNNLRLYYGSFQDWVKNGGQVLFE